MGFAFSSLSRFLLLGLALGAAQTFVSAQVQPTPQTAPANPFEMPKDPVKFVESARKSNGLTAPELPPWHLKATFTLFDVMGNAIDHGTYEEFTAGPSRDKFSFISSNLATTAYQNGNREVAAGPFENTPDLYWLMRRAFADPLPAKEMPYRYLPATPTSNFESIHLSCLSALYVGGLRQSVIISSGVYAARTPEEAMLMAQMNTIQIPNTPTRTPSQMMWDSRLCFDQDTPLLRLISDPLGMGTIRNNVFLFEGKYIPRDVFIGEYGRVELKAHLEVLEDLKPVNDSDFVPPKDAVKQKSAWIEYLPEIKVQKLQTQFVPANYPPSAEAAHVTGTVHIRAIIGLDGQVHDAHVLDGPLQLQQAALDAVSRYRFKPFYDVNERQDKVGTVFEVNFPAKNN